MEANLGAKGKSLHKKVNEQKFRFFHLPTRDLEGVPKGELGEVPTPTRTTGKEIGLAPHQDCSGVLTAVDHATGMITSVEGADVVRYKHHMIWVLIPPPPVIRCKSQKKSSWFIGPYAISNSPLFFFALSLRDRYRMLKTLSPVPHSLQQDLAGSFHVQ